MAINEDQIRKLIKDYEGYREECLGVYSNAGTARAGLYGAVLNDLKELLPRETLEDVAGDDLSPYVGTWVGYADRQALVLTVAPRRLFVIIPTACEVFWTSPDMVFPLDIPRVWDEEGDLAY